LLAPIHAIGRIADHIHLAVSIPPRIAILEFVREVKGGSGRVIDLEFADDEMAFGWQPEYGVVSFGERSLERVVSYVSNQGQHHRDQTLWPEMELIERVRERDPSPGGAS
jgi:REP element-mobilizing transposase RayT